MEIFHFLQTYFWTIEFWLLLILGVIVISYIRSRRYNLPPLPHGWPIVGNMFAMDQKQTYRWLKKIAKTYGPVFRVKFGPLGDAVVINDIKTAHEALIERGKDFSGRPVSMLLEEISENYQSVGFSDPDSHMWNQRKKLQAVAIRNFTSGRVYEKRVVKCFGKLMEHFDKKVDSGKPFNPKDYCKLFIYNQISGMCFSRTYEMDDPVFLGMIKDFETFNGLFNQLQITDILPFARYLPFDLPDRKRARKILESLFGFFMNELQQHKEAFTGKETDDLTFYIMKMMAEDDTLAQITDVEQRQIILDVFGAGIDSSQIQFRWMLGCLAQFQEIQDKIYEEILEIIGPIYTDDEEFGVSATDYKAKMPYSEAFLLEVSRYGTVAVMGLPRKTMRDTKLGEYDIPKGTQVMINQWAINFDERENDNPDEFRPERFLNDDGFLGRRPDSYMPFGLGRRSCPGEGSTRNTLWMTMIMVLRRYIIKPTSDDFKVEYNDSFFVAEPRDFEIRLCYRDSD